MAPLPRELISLRLRRAGSATPSVVWAKVWSTPRGGAAWARDRYQFNGQVLTSPSFVTPFNFGASETRVGWTVGAGVEWAVWENWSVKLEYDYLDCGSRTVTFNDPLLGAANISVSQRISEVKLGVNYRFGSPLPRY